MPRLAFSATFDHPVEDVFRWHARPGAFERLVPPWDEVTVRSRRGTIVDGDTLEMAIRQGPFTVTWRAHHEGYVQDRQFVDVQASGPFASWRHVHRFVPVGPTRSVLHDEVDFHLPLHPVSQWIAGRAVAGRLDRMFAFRHRRTQADLDRHRQFALRPRLRVGITGADRSPGRDLAAFLSTGGHEVFALALEHALLRARRPFDTFSVSVLPPSFDAVVLTAATPATWAGANEAFDVLGRLPSPPSRLIVACDASEAEAPLVSAAESTARELGVSFSLVSLPASGDWASVDALIESAYVALMLRESGESRHT